MFPHPYAKPSLPLLLLLLSVAGCGGGGSSSDSTITASETPVSTPSNKSPEDTPPASAVPLPAATSAPLVMSCIDGPAYQCSGNSLIRSENGIALTSSGVQAYGKSTSDLATPIVNTGTASGFALSSGGLAEIRIAKDSNGLITGPAMLLSNLGISWDGKTERPNIAETFNTTQGRVQLNANGTLTFAALPNSADLGFYDFATKGLNGTQINYANNRYFPRTGNPSRCPAGVTSCPTVETAGLQNQAGNWRTGGTTPDLAYAARLHSDGDVHAGNGLPDANGNPTILPEGSGIGVPFPGSKGYRDFLNWGLQYANLSTWITQDTVQIAEWTGGPGSSEHNQNRRGIVAFGSVTDSASIPTTGSATYSGIAYGWYTPTPNAEPSVFHGTVTVSVNFVSRQVTVTIQDTLTYDASATPVPVALKANTAMGAAGANVANYLTGTVDNGTLKGGLSGRYFGPIIATGTSGAGPAEIAGALSLSNATGGAAVVGGFIARKQ